MVWGVDILTREGMRWGERAQPCACGFPAKRHGLSLGMRKHQKNPIRLSLVFINCQGQERQGKTMEPFKILAGNKEMWQPKAACSLGLCWTRKAAALPANSGWDRVNCMALSQQCHFLICGIWGCSVGECPWFVGVHTEVLGVWGIRPATCSQRVQKKNNENG